jgi:hypothetical protein
LTLYFPPFWTKHSKESYDTYRRSAFISFRRDRSTRQVTAPDQT